MRNTLNAGYSTNINFFSGQGRFPQCNLVPRLSLPVGENPGNEVLPTALPDWILARLNTSMLLRDSENA